MPARSPSQSTAARWITSHKPPARPPHRPRWLRPTTLVARKSVSPRAPSIARGRVSVLRSERAGGGLRQKVEERLSGRCQLRPARRPGRSCIRPLHSPPRTRVPLPASHNRRACTPTDTGHGGSRCRGSVRDRPGTRDTGWSWPVHSTTRKRIRVAARSQPQPSSCSRSSSIPKWCAISWTTVTTTSSTTSSSVSHMSSRASR